MEVYADYAATAPLRPEAYEAMIPYLTQGYGNASGIYRISRDAKRGLENARRLIAQTLDVKPEEVYFTSGGTESDNWALKASMEKGASQGWRHMVTTSIEHPAVQQTAKWLERNGCEVTVLPVDRFGRVTPEQVAAAVREDTQLVSIMHANNEIGTIQPIKEIFSAVKAKNAKTICHTDAVQTAGHIPVPADAADLISLSGHKIGGPKGVGALIIRRTLSLPPFQHGGGHERGRRSGTENVAGAAGFAAAFAAAGAAMPETMHRISALRDRLIAGILSIPYSRLTGDPSVRLPGNASFVFESVEGESLVLALDMNGVSVSSGSACSSGSLDPSHVLLAIGLPHEIAHGSLRFTLGESVTQDEVDYMIEITAKVVRDRRAMSPLWDAQTQKPLPFEGDLFAEHH